MCPVAASGCTSLRLSFTPPRPSAPTAGSWPLSRRRIAWRGRTPGASKVFDVETGQARTNLPEQAMDASLVRFSPTGLLAVIATDRNSAPNLVLCDLQAGRAVATEPLPAAFSFINVLAFSPDGRFLIIAARQGPACQVRELPSGRLVQELSLKAAGSEAIAVRSSDESLVTIDRFGNVREWDLPSARPGSLDSGRVLDQAGDVALAAGGREVVAVKEGDDSVPGGHFFIHNAATGQVLRQFARQGPGNYMSNRGERPFEVSARVRGSPWPSSSRTVETSTISKSGTRLPASGFSASTRTPWEEGCGPPFGCSTRRHSTPREPGSPSASRAWSRLPVKEVGTFVGRACQWSRFPRAS